MASSALIAVALAIVEPVIDTEAIDVESPQATRGKPLEGRNIASLVDLDATDVRVESDVLPGEQPLSIDAVFDVGTNVTHELDGSIRELEIGVAVLARSDLEFAWTRLHTPPLQLTTVDAEKKMPLPVAVLTLQAEDGSLAADGEQRLALREEYPDLPMPKDGPLGYLLAIGGYTLEAPSERDVLRILDDGGPADLAALANWAMETAANEQLVFDDAARSRIMANIDAQIRLLRAPPAFGDFQRLNALTAVACVCASGDDLERLLVLVRPMTILLSAAQVSYDGAAAEEAALGVSIHGFRRLQSRSDSALAWESTLRHLRASALDRLVRLSYEREDFPDAPALPRSPLHVQASQLLLPLTTTEVARVLAAATGRTATQRELLRFYVEVRHAAVVEPLVEWLVEHPSHVDDLGVPALGSIGDRMLPVLVRRFEDREAAPAERVVIWRLLASLPERHAAELTQLSRAMGVDVDGHRSGAEPTLVEVLEALREHDEKIQAKRIAELEQELAKPARTITEIRARVRAAELLIAASPQRAEESADAVIAAHVEAARAFDVDFPLERRTALRRLSEMPLGTRHADAARASAVVDAELASMRGESAEALTALERFDPALEHPDVHAAYLGILQARWDALVADGAWDELDAMLRRVDELGPRFADSFDVAAHRIELERHRARPKLVVAVIVGSASFLLLSIALHVLGVFARVRRRLRRKAARMSPPVDAESIPGSDDVGADADDSHASTPIVEANVDATVEPEANAADRAADRGADQAGGWTTDGGSPLDDVA